MTFIYRSAEAAAAAAAASEAARLASLVEYEELQQWLLFRTWRFGLLFSGYLLFVASSEVGGRAGGLAGWVGRRGMCRPPGGTGGLVYFYTSSTLPTPRTPP